MQIPSDAVNKEFVVQSVPVMCPLVFKEGHVCSSADAHVLNQTVIENVRNNIAAKVKALAESGQDTPEEVQKLVDEYIKEYEFGERRGGGVSADPVKREALAIATDLVKKKLKERGKKLSEIENSEIRKLAEAAVEKYPQITEQAKQVVAAKQSSLDLDLGAVE
jgi:hypothetical protein